ncbi:MAG: WG repeat-containing protein [Bacteroides sp.]|nr:WG repeat-containing protein [Bacteroides sp.]
MKRLITLLFVLCSICSICTLCAEEFTESLPNVTHQIAADGPFNRKLLLDTLNYKLVRNDGSIVRNTNPRISVAVDNSAYVFNNARRYITIFTIDSINEIHRVKGGFSQLFPFPSGCSRTVAADQTNRLGIIDRKGEFKVYLDSAITTVRNFSEGYAVIATSRGYGYVDTLGNEVIKSRFTEAYRFNCGHAVVKKPHNGDYFIIDKKGRQKANVSFLDYEAPLPKTPTFYCGLLPMWKKDKTVMLDFNAKEVFSMPGRWLLNGAVDSCLLISNKGIYRVINTEGTVLTENHAPIWLLGAERLSKKDGDVTYLCNLQGQHIVSTPFVYIRPFYDEQTAFATTTDGRWIIIDIEGQELSEIPELRGWNMHPRISMLPPFEDYITTNPKRL